MYDKVCGKQVVQEFRSGLLPQAKLEDFFVQKWRPPIVSGGDKHSEIKPNARESMLRLLAINQRKTNKRQVLAFS